MAMQTWFAGQKVGSTPRSRQDMLSATFRAIRLAARDPYAKVSAVITWVFFVYPISCAYGKRSMKPFATHAATLIATLEIARLARDIEPELEKVNQWMRHEPVPLLRGCTAVQLAASGEGYAVIRLLVRIRRCERGVAGGRYV